MPRVNPSKSQARTITRAPLSLDQFLKNALDGIFALDRDRKFVLFNAAAERITGYSASEVIGTNCSCHAFIDCHDEQGRSLAGFLCPARHLGGNAEVDGARQRMRIRRKDGGQVWVETIYTPLRSASGEIELFLGIMRDISEVHAKEADLIATLADLRAENARLLEERRGRFGFATIISRATRMQPIFERIHAATTNTVPILVAGERGTGKDLVARTIHEHGPRRDGPFLIGPAPTTARESSERDLFGDGPDGKSPGLLDAARGGTLYLNDLTRLSLEAQLRLARWLADQTAGAGRDSRSARSAAPRIVAALAEEPAMALKTGRIRDDLLAQLSSIFIQLPPLRLRREDIPSLVQHFLDAHNAAGRRKVSDISPKAWSVLLAYAWPANVSELATVVRAAHENGSGPMLQANDLPSLLQKGPAAAEPAGADSLKLDPILEQIERQTILDALRRANGQRNMAARLMGISRSRLYRRMEVLGITHAAPGDPA